MSETPLEGELTPETLRAKWQVGIDEDDPNYAFIGIEGGTICWVENDDASAFGKIAKAHNATLAAWEADRDALRERMEKAIRLLRWWADKSMDTSSLTEIGVVSQIRRRRETEDFFASLPPKESET